MAELACYPKAYLTGAWQGPTPPVAVDGGSYVGPSSVGVDSAGYQGLDSAADALQEEIFTLPTVADDDVALLVTAVTDETATGAIGTAPVYGYVNKVVSIQNSQTSGTFTLTFDAQTTAAIAFDATAAAIQSALEALSNIDVGDVACSGGPVDASPVLIEFRGQYSGLDKTVTASPTYVAPVNEVQRISSDRTGGTYTITYDGQTTSSLNWNSTAAEVDTALEALSNIGAGDVTCTGGPLPTDIDIEFTGALAATDVNEITITDSGTGGTGITPSTVTGGVAEVLGLTITTDTAAVAGSSFTSQGTINVPIGGAAYEPQAEMWTAVLTAADSGGLVRATVADHDTLHSWAVAMAVLRGADTTTPIDAVGSVEQGEATAGGFGSVTTVTDGARVVTIGARARDTNGTVNPSSIPDGRVSLVSAESDSMTLDLTLGGIIEAQTVTPSVASWGQTLHYFGTCIAIRPATALAGGASLYEVIDAQDTTDWLELEPAMGTLTEVFEVDLAGLPAGGVPTGARIEFAHQATVWSKLDVTLAGITAGGDVAEAVPHVDGYYPEPVGQIDEQETALWSQFPDGAVLSDYPRLGVLIRAAERHPSLTTHRLYWARVVVIYDSGGPVVSSVAGPATAGDQVTWTYSSASGRGQSGYQVMVIAGSGQNPDTATVAADPFNPSAGEIVADSGRVNEPLARAADLPGPVGDAVHTVAVRAWARLSSGAEVVSDWDTADFNITGTAPGSGTHSTDAAFNGATGMVDVEVNVPAGVTRAWLARSDDGGATYTVTDDSPYTVTPSTTETLVDTGAEFGDSVRYQVVFDAGANNESSSAAAVGAPVTITVSSWWLLVPADPSLSTPIRVKDVSFSRPVRAVTVEQPGNSVTALSAPLARRASIGVWVDDNTAYLAIIAALEAQHPIEVLDIWGRRIRGRCVSGLEDAPQRWRRLPTETTGLRDAHVFTFDMVEEV